MIEMPTEAEPVKIVEGDSIDVLPCLKPDSVDSVVTDPPYGLTGASRNGSPRTNDPATPFGLHNLQAKGFMGLQWDGKVPGVALWEKVKRVLRPGGYMLAMGGTRTYHRLACAVEDAGFEMRDCLMWLYGSGFPKGKGCLKPAWEPILLCRKPGPTVLPLGVDECRIELNGDYKCKPNGRPSQTGLGDNYDPAKANQPDTIGRWPANVILDDEAAAILDEQTGELVSGPESDRGHRRNADHEAKRNCYGGFQGQHVTGVLDGDRGGASRFFYCAKASRAERDEGLDTMPLVSVGMMEDDDYSWEGEANRGRQPRDAKGRNTHPTVKPLALMRWLVLLVTPKDGTVLDPFAGSGSTLVAGVDHCFGIGIEREPKYVTIARARVNAALRREPGSLFAAG